jgi:hypothetical protein
MARLRRRTRKISRVGPVFAPKRIGARPSQPWPCRPSRAAPGGGPGQRAFPECQSQLPARAPLQPVVCGQCPRRGRLQARLLDYVGAPPAVRPSPCRWSRNFTSTWASTWPAAAYPACRQPGAASVPDPQRMAPDRRCSTTVCPGWSGPSSHGRAAGLRTRRADVLTTLSRWLADGTSRFGVVVRHRELGYRANAMCVWQVPEMPGQRLRPRPCRRGRREPVLPPPYHLPTGPTTCSA